MTGSLREGPLPPWTRNSYESFVKNSPIETEIRKRPEGRRPRASGTSGHAPGPGETSSTDRDAEVIGPRHAGVCPTRVRGGPGAPWGGECPRRPRVCRENLGVYAEVQVLVACDVACDVARLSLGLCLRDDCPECQSRPHALPRGLDRRPGPCAPWDIKTGVGQDPTRAHGDSSPRRVK